MIRADMIPDEAWEAAMKTDPRDGLRAAIAAALNAWPNGGLIKWPAIFLPLPQEPRDE